MWSILGPELTVTSYSGDNIKYSNNTEPHNIGHNKRGYKTDYLLDHFKITTSDIADNTFKHSEKFKRIGHLFEYCWQQLLEKTNIPFLTNIPVRDNQKHTLGELDLVLLEDNHYWHIEFAVKFYLGINIPSSSYGCSEQIPPQTSDQAATKSLWIGPNQRDRFDEKLDKLAQHQLTLSSSKEAQLAIGQSYIKKYTENEKLEVDSNFVLHKQSIETGKSNSISNTLKDTSRTISNDISDVLCRDEERFYVSRVSPSPNKIKHKLAIVKGCLFHPFPKEKADTVELPSTQHNEINIQVKEDHWCGYWLSISDAHNYLRSQYWSVLPKNRWLSPAVVSQAISTEELLTLLDIHFAHIAQPVCIVELSPDRDIATDYFFEKSRWFIVPDDWQSSYLTRI